MKQGYDAAFQRFKNQANRAPRLDRAQEQELWRRWSTKGDVSARDVIIASHLRYVVQIALKYRYYSVPLTDLVSEGNMGLTLALRKFDGSNRFITYAAFWIRACIVRYIVRARSIVSSGGEGTRSKIIFRLRRERAKLSNHLTETDDIENELARRLNLPVKKVRSVLLQLDTGDLSMQTEVCTDMLLGDTLPSELDIEEDYSATESERHAKTVVDDALSCLDRRELYIMRDRMQDEPQTLAELGRTLGVSRERARQLEARAKKKMVRRMNQRKMNGEWVSITDACIPQCTQE